MVDCDFCGSHQVGDVYVPAGTIRAATVTLCDECGLLQTRYGQHERDRTPRMSGDADWGNVRWCKSFRMDAVKGALETFLPIKQEFSVLDIGSNRGDFLEWVLSAYPNAKVFGIEPDERLAASYSEQLRSAVTFKRFEDCAFADSSIDFVYCVQTLEHARSASEMLKGIWRVLKDGGLAFIEVPNTNVLKYSHTVEEFFIDKHSFHFTERTLRPFVESIGFEVVKSNEDNDRHNVSFYLRKSVNSSNLVYRGQIGASVIGETRRAVAGYSQNLVLNRQLLPKVVEKIDTLNDRMKVAFWGATTIFDVLVRYGGLDPSSVKLLVDTYLHRFASDNHGVLIQEPDAIKAYDPQVCIVLARFSADAIADIARGYGVRNVLTFEQLICSVK